MSFLIEFSMFPTDKGDSVSEYVSRILKVIDESGISYSLNSMGTTIETKNLEDAMDIIKKCYNTLEYDCNRIYASIKMDIRKNKDNRLKNKIKSIEKILGKDLKAK